MGDLRIELQAPVYKQTRTKAWQTQDRKNIKDPQKKEEVPPLNGK